MLAPGVPRGQCQSGPMNWQKRLRVPLGAAETLHVALSDAAAPPEHPRMTTLPRPVRAG